MRQWYVGICLFSHFSKNALPSTGAQTSMLSTVVCWSWAYAAKQLQWKYIVIPLLKLKFYYNKDIYNNETLP